MRVAILASEPLEVNEKFIPILNFFAVGNQAVSSTRKDYLEDDMRLERQTVLNHATRAEAAFCCEIHDSCLGWNSKMKMVK